MLMSVSAGATQVDIAVAADPKAPLKDELVIVSSLEGQGEICRVLSNSQGATPTLDLKPGIYRAIAANPYGIWETKIVEFLVNTTPVSLKILVRPMGTHGFGDRVPVWLKGERPRTIDVLVVDKAGKPFPGANILSRNEDLDFDQWFLTGPDGIARVKLLPQPVTIVAATSSILVSVTPDTKSLDGLHGKPLVIKLE
jgi:hypothetical protein